MMGFPNRKSKSDKIIQLLEQQFWHNPDISNIYGILHEPYGYENYMSEEAQSVIKTIYTTTAKHIRFTPDYVLICRRQVKNPVVLLEYKVTTTPRYTLGNNQWNFGQIEADAWENYINLINAKVVVALLIYCPYHPRPLLCDFPDVSWTVQDRRTVKSTATGSKTDYYNIDLRKLRTFVEFMEQEFLVPSEITLPLVKTLLNIAKTDPDLQIQHDPRSPYKDRKAGFNWLPDLVAE